MGGPKWRIEDCHVIMREARPRTIVGDHKWRIEDCHVIMWEARPGTIVVVLNGEKSAVTFNAGR